MADAADRALLAFLDVLAVEWDEDLGMARIVTMGDKYLAVPEQGQHLCPDRKHNLNGEGLCKHLWALEITRDRNAPEGWLVVDDLDDRTEDEFELDVRAPRENCEQCGGDLACPQHHGLSLGQEGDA